MRQGSDGLCGMLAHSRLPAALPKPWSALGGRPHLDVCHDAAHHVHSRLVCRLLVALTQPMPGDGGAGVVKDCAGAVVCSRQQPQRMRSAQCNPGPMRPAATRGQALTSEPRRVRRPP